MASSEILQQEQGFGDLVLKNEVRKEVEWQIERLSNGSLGKGCIHGDVEHLAAAAQDGWAILHLSPDEAAAVSIETCTDGEASFTTMVPVVTPVVFEAASIVSLDLNSDNTLFSIEYRGLHADHLLVSLPTETMRNCLPRLQAFMAVPSAGTAMTSYFTISPPWEMGTLEVQPFVFIKFADGAPMAFSPQQARRLAAGLIKQAKEVESR